MKTTLTMPQLLDNYSEEIIALAQHLDCDPEDITPEAYGDIYSINGEEYLVCDDDTADKYWDDDLDNYLEECVYPELQGNLSMYFDDEKWKRDARMDGRANSLSRYDGKEDEETVNGTIYYIYRQN